MTLPLPHVAAARTWRAIWTQNDGKFLAEEPVVLSPLGEEGSVRLELDHPDVDLKTTTMVTIKAFGEDKKPLAYKNGRLTVQTARPEIEGWQTYRFGDVTAQQGQKFRSFHS